MALIDACVKDVTRAMHDEFAQVLRDLLRLPRFDQADQWELVEVSFSDNGHERPRPLRARERAVYAFFQGQTWLRIGQTGHSPRFTSQHYGTGRANSTFAKDLWNNREEFGYNGPEDTIGEWIFDTFVRANLILPAQWPATVSPLVESYLHYRLHPRFEGRR